MYEYNSSLENIQHGRCLFHKTQPYRQENCLWNNRTFSLYASRTISLSRRFSLDCSTTMDGCYNHHITHHHNALAFLKELARANLGPKILCGRVTSRTAKKYSSSASYKFMRYAFGTFTLAVVNSRASRLTGRKCACANLTRTSASITFIFSYSW